MTSGGKTSLLGFGPMTAGTMHPLAGQMGTDASAVSAGVPDGLAGGGDAYVNEPPAGDRTVGGRWPGRIRDFIDRLRRPERRSPSRPSGEAPCAGPAAAYLQREVIRHNGCDLVFYDLEAYVGTITAGLRADTDPEKRVGMAARYAPILESGGVEGLYDALIAAGVLPSPVCLDDCIYQTDDKNRSVVEIASNSIDASRADVRITLKDGFYEVADTGKGMNDAVIVERLLVPKLSGKPDPSQQNGRFGIGFMTALRHLKNEGEYVEVFTQSQDGRSHEIVYLMRGGRMKIGTREARPSGVGGTHIRAASADIRKAEMDAEITKYLRYVNDGRNVYVNGERRSHFDFPQAESFSRPGDYGRIFVNPDHRNSVTVKIGELIYESYETGDSALAGDVIIELPYSAEYAPTRDFAAVDDALYAYMQTLIVRARTLAELNTLAPLLEKMDVRHDREPLMEAARSRAAKVAEESHKGRRIYPERARLKEKTSGDVIFVHPSLYHPEWLGAFETPKEFISGEVVSAGGWRRPMSLVLSPDITAPLVLDPDGGVLYLNEAIYKERPEFVLSAAFMVPGMEFNVRWLPGAMAAGGLKMFAGRGEETHAPSSARATPEDAPELPAIRKDGRRVEPKPPAGQRDEKEDRANLGAIAEFLEGRGLLLADFARKIPEGYSAGSRETMGGRDYVNLECVGGGKVSYNLMDIETGRLLLERDAMSIYRVADLICAAYENGSMVFRPDGTLLGKGMGLNVIGKKDSTPCILEFKDATVFDAGGREIAKGNRIVISSTGRHIWLSVDDDSNSRVLKEDGTHFADGYIASVLDVGGEDMPVVRTNDGITAQLMDERGAVILSGFDVDARMAGGEVYYYLDDKTGGRRWIKKGGTVVFKGVAEIREAGGKAWFWYGGSWGDVYDSSGKLFLEGDGGTTTEILDTPLGALFLITRGGRMQVVREDKTVVMEAEQIAAIKKGGVLHFHLTYANCQRLARIDGRVIAEGKVLYMEKYSQDYFRVWVEDGRVVRKFDVTGKFLRGETDDAEFFKKGPRWVIEKEGGIERLVAGGVVIADRAMSISPALGGRKDWFKVAYGWSGHDQIFSLDGALTPVVKKVDGLGDGHSAIFAVQTDDNEYALLDEDARVLMRGELVAVGGMGDTLVVGVVKNGVRRTYVKVGDRLILASENEPLPRNQFWWVGVYVDALPLENLARLVESPNLAARLGELRQHRLSADRCFYALMHADDALWREFIGSRAKREILSLITSPEALAYAAAHAGDGERELKKALILMGHLPPLMGTDDKMYMERFERLLESGIDIDALISDISRGRESEDILAVRHFLRDRDVVGIGRPTIERPNARAKRLADVVTHIRLGGKSAGIDGARKAMRHNCEVDRRALEHAITHLNAAHPNNYQKQLLQNSLDVQAVAGRVAEGEHKIETDTFMDGPDFIFRMRDFGGMTEDEVMDLLKPGDGSKVGPSTGSGRGGVFRGGFGEGFYSTLADAKWVRLKTAVAGSKEIIILDFEVIRDARGRMNDILIRMGKAENGENFHGTIVETARYSKLPLLDASRARTRMTDMGQYVSNSEAEIFVDGAHVNEGRNGPLVETVSKTIGRVSLYDGLANRILLGKLPLMDLPEELWAAVPDGVKDYFRRKGFYIDLDHTVLKPAPTWDRLQEQAEVMGELKSILPALLIRGFLMRVASANSSEDLNDLPEVYFVEAYELAGREAIGRSNSEAAERINGGDFNVDAARYFGEDGREEIIRLLTVIKFVSVEGFDDPLSLADIHKIYLKTARGDETAKEKLAKVTAAALPKGIRERLQVAQRVADSASAGAARVERDSIDSRGIVRDMAPERTYEMDDVLSEDHRRYLSLVEKITRLVWRPFGGRSVRVGINTRKDHAAFFAYHFASRGRYNLYLSYGAALDAGAAELADILMTSDPEIALARFNRYLARLYEVITHEFTHALRGHKDSFTHAPKFYADQMEIMPEPPIDADQARRWMEELKG